MNDHPTTWTRRQFLISTLTAGAAVMSAPSVLATGTIRAENTVALLSDTHISGDRTTRKRGVNMSDHLQTALQQVLASKSKPAHLLIAGDLANRVGEPYDYPALSALLAPARENGMEPHFVLGNHDDRAHFLSVFAKGLPLAIPGKFVQIWRTETANWFLLDSLQHPNHTPGRLGKGQRNWLEQELDVSPEQPAILVFHHNIASDSKETSGLEDADDLFDIIRPRPQVKACIFGHTHQFSVRTDESGIHLINLPAVAYPFTEAPVGWVMATVQKKGLRLELRTLDPQHKDNKTITRLRWRSNFKGRN